MLHRRELVVRFPELTRGQLDPSFLLTNHDRVDCHVWNSVHHLVQVRSSILPQLADLAFSKGAEVLCFARDHKCCLVFPQFTPASLARASIVLFFLVSSDVRFTFVDAWRINHSFNGRFDNLRVGLAFCTLDTIQQTLNLFVW